MDPATHNPPLIVILGQTASGKSALALDLARRFNGEIIAADSRTVYKGMDIGTAKPSAQDQELVRHHLVDIVRPDEPFTVADFQRLAQDAIADIARRGKVPFLVGGSGLYIDAVIYEFSFRRPADPVERQRLEALSADELRALVDEQGIAFPASDQNPRHLIRALETAGEVPARSQLRPNTLVIGLHASKDVLSEKIRQRVEAMVQHGFADEVAGLAEQYGWDVPALQAPGYKEFRLYLAGQISLEQAKQTFVRSHVQYAKRQKTWFKRNPDIHWISNPAESVDLVTTLLNK